MTSTPRIEPLYVVDTNALIWYLNGDKKLTPSAARIFAAAENGNTLLYLSVVVIAELYYANKKWNWFPSFPILYADIKSKPYFRLVPLEAAEILDFDRDAAVPEMHDRIIAGLARRLNAPLLTSDASIHNAAINSIVW